MMTFLIGNIIKNKVVTKMANKPVLDQRQVNRILVLKSQGLSDSLIATRIGTSRRIISDVVNGKYNPIHIESGYDSPLN